MNLELTLATLADEHLEKMSSVGWYNYAKALNEKRRGETFGCEIDGIYFDVGDKFEWEVQTGGPIRLTAFAYTSEQRIERSIILKEKSG